MNLNKIKLHDVSYDIVPTQLTNGTYIAQVPSLTASAYVVTMNEDSVSTIPAFPSTGGTYVLYAIPVSDGTITLAWK